VYVDEQLVDTESGILRQINESTFEERNEPEDTAHVVDENERQYQYVVR
jgi:hypothetical protein